MLSQKVVLSVLVDVSYVLKLSLVNSAFYGNGFFWA